MALPDRMPLHLPLIIQCLSRFFFKFYIPQEMFPRTHGGYASTRMNTTFCIIRIEGRLSTWLILRLGRCRLNIAPKHPWLSTDYAALCLFMTSAVGTSPAAFISNCVDPSARQQNSWLRGMIAAIRWYGLCREVPWSGIARHVNVMDVRWETLPDRMANAL
jgi:hypothetical protein